MEAVVPNQKDVKALVQANKKINDETVNRLEVLPIITNDNQYYIIILESTVAAITPLVE